MAAASASVARRFGSAGRAHAPTGPAVTSLPPGRYGRVLLNFGFKDADFRLCPCIRVFQLSHFASCSLLRQNKILKNPKLSAVDLKLTVLCIAMWSCPARGANKNKSNLLLAFACPVYVSALKLYVCYFHVQLRGETLCTN